MTLTQTQENKSHWYPMYIKVLVIEYILYIQYWKLSFFYGTLLSYLWLFVVYILYHFHFARANFNVWAAFLKLLNRQDQFIVHQVMERDN